MAKSDIRASLKMVAEILRFAVIIPLAPLAIGLVFLFAWGLGKAAEIPEDLDEQVRLANRKIEE